MSRRVLFLYSDTGGGHRSATEAMIDALEEEFPGVFDATRVDFFSQYYPAPLSKAGNIYPTLTRLPSIWGMSYSLSDGRIRTKLASMLAFPIVKRATERMIKENPADLIVSVHPLVNTLVLRAMRKAPVPFVTVVTDMVSTHSFWFDRKTDLVLVPTQQASDAAQRAKISKGNIRVIGLPVGKNFCEPNGTKTELRQELGWDPELPTLLLVGGGDGMGAVIDVANAINESDLRCQLVIICGRNKKLRERMERIDWKVPCYRYGFVKNLADFMYAADVLLSKAGSSTISEAFVVGLPVILYSCIPGQEVGNVEYVVQERAGVWAPEPENLVATLRDWLDNPDVLAEAAANSARLARPHAAQLAARILADHIGVPGASEKLDAEWQQDGYCEDQ